MQIDVEEVAGAAKYWLRRELKRSGLEGSLAPRVVNPRAQGWLAGFVGELASGLGLDAAKTYELEARLYVGLFEGTPMGEQLGLESLQMAKFFAASPTPPPGWKEYGERGTEGGRHLVALLHSLDELGSAFG
jgi:hypothetical protein